jgi:hypothetical protein
MVMREEASAGRHPDTHKRADSESAYRCRNPEGPFCAQNHDNFYIKVFFNVFYQCFFINVFSSMIFTSMIFTSMFEDGGHSHSYA